MPPTFLIPEMYAFLIYGGVCLAGMACLLIAGIFTMQMHAQLKEMNSYAAQTCEGVGKMGLAVIAITELEKEMRTDFANAFGSSIQAIKLLRNEIEYQREIAEIYRRKRETVPTEPLSRNGENADYNYKPTWDQP